MTKRIVSGIFILTALGALGVILAGALTSGEQLIVRFLTAVIVAALGLYVISDLRLQADDDAMTARSTSHPRLTSVDAPPNSTAAFMATVTRRSEHKTGEIDVTPAPPAQVVDEQTDQQMVGAGATTSSAAESTSAAVEDAESTAQGPPPAERATARPAAPDTVRAEVFGPPTDAGLRELFAANGAIPQQPPGLGLDPAAHSPGGADGPAVPESRPHTTGPIPSVFDSPNRPEEAHAGDRRPDQGDEATDGIESAAEAPVNDGPLIDPLADSAAVNREPATTPDEAASNAESSDDTAVIDALAAEYDGGPLRQAELAVAAMTGSGVGDSEFNGAHGSHGPVNGAAFGHAPSTGPSGNHDRNGSPLNGSPLNGSPGSGGPGGGSPFSAPANGRRPNGTPRRLLDSIEGLSDIAGLGRSLGPKPVNGADTEPPATVNGADSEPPATVNGADSEPPAAAATAETDPSMQSSDAVEVPEASPSTPSGFQYSDELNSPVGDWPAPPVEPVETTLEPHPFEKASAAYQAEKARLAAAADAADLPIVSPKHGLDAADYADAPLAPIIDLRHVNSQNPSSVDAAINAGEVEVIATLIEQGMLSTNGPISDRDVRTMVYVAFTSNELRKLLLAGGTPDGPNFGLDLGPVELFDERVHAPAPKRLYSGMPQPHPQPRAQSQIG